MVVQEVAEMEVYGSENRGNQGQINAIVAFYSLQLPYNLDRKKKNPTQRVRL
jgi:hypothetical protein